MELYVRVDMQTRVFPESCSVMIENNQLAKTDRYILTVPFISIISSKKPDAAFVWRLTWWNYYRRQSSGCAVCKSNWATFTQNSYYLWFRVKETPLLFSLPTVKRAKPELVSVALSRRPFSHLQQEFKRTVLSLQSGRDRADPWWI